MDTMLTCSACGHTGYGVRSRIVEAPEGATVTVLGLEIPQRYATEPRCIDQTACDERQPVEETT